MIFIFLFSVLLLVVVAFVFGHTIFPMAQNRRMKKRLLKEGVEAEAVLLNIEQTGMYVNHQPQLKLQVQVHPLNGRNFVTDVREVLTLKHLGRLRIGGRLKVKYNPANTKEVVMMPQPYLSL